MLPSPLSSLSCIWCSSRCINCCPPSPLPCLDPITFKLLRWAGDHDRSAGGSISQITWLILWLWRLFHPIMWRLTKSSGTSPACLIYILILLCGTFWYSLTLPCGLVQESCWECACGPEGEGVPSVAQSGFVTGYVSFRLPLVWCVEAAQRRAISSRQCRVQELAVHQEHQLHRRGESPPAQRAGPLAGNCTRGGAPKIINTVCTSIEHLTLYLMALSTSSDCDKGERSAGVAEEVWRQPTGSGGDEVRSNTLSGHHLRHNEVPPIRYCTDLTPPCVYVKW